MLHSLSQNKNKKLLTADTSLPPGWHWLKLGDVALGKRAIVSGPFGSNIGSRYFVSEGVPVIRGNNLTTDERKFIDDGFVFLTQIKAKEFANCQAIKDDLVFTGVGTLGQVGIIPAGAEYPIYIISNKQLRVRLDTSVVLPMFAFHWFISPRIAMEIKQNNRGSAVPLITLSVLRNLPICIPSIPEQARIVEILDVADAAVCTTEKLIEAKTRYKLNLAEQLLTECRRFPEFKGKKWREAKLGELFLERVEINRPDLKLLSVSGTEGIVDRDSLVKRDTSNEDKSKYLRVVPGDIAYNTMRMWQGVFGLSKLEGIVSPAYTVCIPDQIDGRFAAFLFKLPKTISLFYRHSQGLVSDTLNCKYPSFAKIRVDLPSLPEQQKIADFLGLLDEEIALLKQERDALKRQKQGLMQKLLTGQVRLKEFAS